MAAYPAAIDSYTPVAGTTLEATADHANMHNIVGSAAVGIETNLGTNSGTSVLKNFVAGDMAARVNNETFGTPKILGGTVGTALVGTSLIQGGTVANALVGTSRIWGGTVGTAIIGTSTIQGGTINNAVLRPSYYDGTFAGTGGTLTIDLSTANEFRLTFGTNNGTLAVSNETNGQKVVISLTQDAVGTRTIAWFSTIKWPASGAPALTTTAAKRDTFGFIVTGADTYDGFIIGQNI